MTDKPCPDGWDIVEYDIGRKGGGGNREFDASWQSEEGTVTVTIQSVEAWNNSGEIDYEVIVEQRIEDDQYATTVTPVTSVVEERGKAISQATDFMNEITEGKYLYAVLGTEEWKDFIQFYCLNESELPGSLTAEDVIEGYGAEEAIEDPDELPDDVDPVELQESDGEVVQVDVFPRHEDAVVAKDT